MDERRRIRGMLASHAALAFVVLAQAAGSPGAPPVLDRVAGIVGDTPIFLSEVRARARPMLAVAEQAAGGDKTKADAARAQLHREMLDRMIDERIEEREAERLHITVSSDELDNAIDVVSKQAKLTKESLFAEAKKQGFSERDYKDEIKRQILEGKLIQLRVRARVKVTDADAKKAYDQFVKDTSGPNAPLDLRIIALRVGDAADDRAKKEALANQIVQKAKSGTDFCSLVTQHSDDTSTKNTCGSHGPAPRSALFPEIAKVAGALDPGKTAAPLFFTEPSGGKVFLVIQRGAAVATPSFESVKDQMKERAYMETVERERKQWLGELRKGTFVDVRL